MAGLHRRVLCRGLGCDRRPSWARLSWLGLWTLAIKEVRRFLVVWVQTILGPLIATLLFVAIFAVVLRRGGPAPGGLSYLEFVAPGLIMMAVLQNAFANSSSSILIAKLNGTLSDVLGAPLGPLELTAGFALGALVRGVLVGALVALAVAALGALQLVEPARAVLFGLGGALLFALLGIAGGIFAEKMEHIAFMANVVVAPLTMLSGTFYSVAQLPEALGWVARANPVFYLIDGFRRSCTGYGEGGPTAAILVLVAAILLAGALCLRLFATGYRLKA